MAVPAGDSDGEASPLESGSNKNRRRAALAVAPFLFLGLSSVVLVLLWGMDPLWGFMILPPILFCSVLAYIVFSTDFLEDRT
mgnify:CR=1 FL=1|jgi:hypothetical protein